jgi:hypothetical protein
MQCAVGFNPLTLHISPLVLRVGESCQVHVSENQCEGVRGENNLALRGSAILFHAISEDTGLRTPGKTRLGFQGAICEQLLQFAERDAEAD